MGKPLIIVGSITNAMKGRNILLRHAIRSYIERTPHNELNSGCSYSLYVMRNADEAEHILRSSGIPVFGRAERGGRP